MHSSETHRSETHRSEALRSEPDRSETGNSVAVARADSTPSLEPGLAEPAAASSRALLGALAGAVGVTALAGLARGGPISPPAGPIAGTAKPLAEIEPRTPVNSQNTPGDSSSVYRIAAPGSYYLTGDVTVPANKIGIVIAAPDVTLDLNGFRVNGNNTSGSSGISDLGSAQNNITIRNGSVVATGGIGIFLLTRPVRLVDLLVRDNKGAGVLTSSGVVLERVRAVSNAATASNPGGIIVGSECVLIDCVSEFNRGVGISVGAYALLRGCRANQNTANGIDAGLTCVIAGCEASRNAGAGITAQHAAAMEGSTASFNGTVGMSASFASSLRGCVAQSNQANGIALWEGSAINDCVAESNTGVGITLPTGCQAAGCAASFNTGIGIDAGTGCSIRRCVARNNGSHGIRAGARCLLLENNCESNSAQGIGAAGILVTNTSNRIEGNLCGSTGGYGLQVTGTRNYILRNACALNTTNWSITSNCVFGTVVNRVGLSASGMSGNGTVGSTVGTTDPFANISF